MALAFFNLNILIGSIYTIQEWNLHKDMYFEKSCSHSIPIHPVILCKYKYELLFAYFYYPKVAYYM